MIAKKTLKKGTEKIKNISKTQKVRFNTVTLNYKGIEDTDQLLVHLQKFQRIKRLSATWDETLSFLNGGFDSALSVVLSGTDVEENEDK